MDKRYLAGTAEVVILLVIMAIGFLSAPKFGSPALKIGIHATIVAVIIYAYHMYIGSYLYKKLGWLKV